MVDLTLPDALPPQDLGDAAGRLAARVQAWQHRHLLARRLLAADITGFGVVALPYAAAEGGSPPQPLFHQPSLVPGLSHRALVDFARRHAVNYRPGPADWPQRDVERSDASSEPAPLTRYLLTAAVTEPVAPGALPRRLLIAPEGAAIWGPRPLSRPRVLAALLMAGALLLGLGAAGWGLRAKWARPVVVPPAAVTAASAASVSTSASASAASAVAQALPVAASRPASAVAPKAVTPAAVAASTPTAAPPLAASAPLRAAMPPPAAPVASAVASAVAVGRAASTPKGATSAPWAAAPVAPAALPASAPPATSRPALATPIVPPPLLPMPSGRRSTAVPADTPPEAAAAAPASAALPAGPHFALVSVPSKKRAGAEATLAQVRKLLGPAIGNLQAQIMPSPEGFVVTIWPLPTQADAERLAEVLGRRGVPMKWLEF